MKVVRRVTSSNQFDSLLLSRSFCMRPYSFKSDSRRADRPERDVRVPSQSSTDSKHGLETLYQFASGGWLWREREQFAYRYVKFDMPSLLKIAASATGSSSCAEVLKVSEGQYNKVFLPTMNDGREVIAKLPNPNASRPHFTTASEVATMDFLRNVLHIPVPKVYAWSSTASDNAAGAEYIIMEKQTGVVLDDVWESLTGKQKARIVLQVVDFEKALASTKFTRLGALYYNNEIPAKLDTELPLYADSDGNAVYSEKFGIGPTNHRSFFDFEKGTLDIDRGPWSTTTDFLSAVAHREIACANQQLKYPLIPEGLFYGPRQYQPTASKKLLALNNYLKVAPHILPENRATNASVLWHADLHLQNIFVNPTEPTEILGIIDWQSVSACPLFMQVRRPAFLDYNGPPPKELGLVHLPENFDSMTPDEQQKAKALHEA